MHFQPCATVVETGQNLLEYKYRLSVFPLEKSLQLILGIGVTYSLVGYLLTDNILFNGENRLQKQCHFHFIETFRSDLDFCDQARNLEFREVF